MPADAPRIDGVDVAAYRIPTDRPEADGTLEWCATTLVVVTVQAGAHSGLGYSYTHHAAAELVRDRLADVVTGRDAFAIPACWQAMVEVVRNLGRPGLASAAIAAVDAALWDLKAHCLELPLVDLLGRARDAVPV
ncbi:MAG TPA: hypothetical protein VLT59_02165 [Steroidobacteraceae bacterium]|nr:hypothetical protein [Steroidobacteraceae bacterium]